MTESTRDMADSTTRIVQILLKDMTPEERLQLWADLKAGHCEHCGSALGDRGRCVCWRDE